MIYEELQNRYGAYTAERIRQALTLDEFRQIDVDELVPLFEHRAEKVYQEYRTRISSPLPKDFLAGTKPAEYLSILRRRWQEAEEIAYSVLKADMIERRDNERRALRA